jgi:hypothetical protein
MGSGAIYAPSCTSMYGLNLHGVPLDLLTLLVVYSSNQAVYPVEFCKPLNDETRKQYWFQCLMTDEACK